MMGKYGNRLIALMLAAALYVLAVSFAGSAREEGRLVHIVLEQGVEASQAKDLFRREGEAEDPVAFCLWGENAGQLVSCPETGGRAQVTQLLLAGNPELLGAGSLAWQEGCLVDAKTARTLFGTEACGGQVLRWEGKAYPVLGTIPALRPTMVLMAGEREQTRLCRGVLALTPETGGVLGEQCLVRWGLRGRVLDIYPLLALMKNLLLLFPGILLLGAWGYLGKDWKTLSISEISQGKQRKLLGKTVLALVLALLTLWALGSRLVVPSDMIPSRWSEFSFWGDWWQAQKENLLWIVAEPLENGQLQMLESMVKSMVNAVAAAVLALLAVRRSGNADTSG